MRGLMVLLLSLATIVLTLASASEGNTTTHVGSRTPPVEAGCWRSGKFLTDEGRLLGVYRCPAAGIR